MSKSFQRAILAACALLAIVVFAASLRGVLRSPGIDLRDKVVGARLLATHQNAYPGPEHPARNEYYRMFSRNTYTPALLAAYVPLSSLPYPAQRYVYFGLDWLCILFLFLQTRSWFSAQNRHLHAAAFVLLLILDPGVWLHMERGQYYLELAALMLLVLSPWRMAENGMQKPRRLMIWISASALAVLVLVRPSFGILLPLLWVQRLTAQAARALLIAAVLMAFLVAAWGAGPWVDFSRVVSAMQSQTVDALFSHRQASAETEGPKPARMAEGENFSVFLKTNYAISRTVLRLADMKGVRKVTVKLFRSPAVLEGVNSVLLLTAAGYCLLLAFRLRGESAFVKMGVALLAPSVIETFGPQRNAYCDVTLVPVAMLVVALILKDGWPNGKRRMGLLLAAGVCLLAAVGALAFSPMGRMVEVVSLLRWFVLLLLVNAYFVAQARRGGSRGDAVASG